MWLCFYFKEHVTERNRVQRILGQNECSHIKSPDSVSWANAKCLVSQWVKMEIQRLWKSLGKSKHLHILSGLPFIPQIIFLIPHSYYSYSQMESDYLAPNFSLLNELNISLRCHFIWLSEDHSPSTTTATSFHIFLFIVLASTDLISLPSPPSEKVFVPLRERLFEVFPNSLIEEEVTMHRNAVWLRSLKDLDIRGKEVGDLHKRGFLHDWTEWNCLGGSDTCSHS